MKVIVLKDEDFHDLRRRLDLGKVEVSRRQGSPEKAQAVEEYYRRVVYDLVVWARQHGFEGVTP